MRQVHPRCQSASVRETDLHPRRRLAVVDFELGADLLPILRLALGLRWEFAGHRSWNDSGGRYSRWHGGSEAMACALERPDATA